MAGLIPKELRTLPAAELRQKLTELQQQIRDLRFKIHQGTAEHPHQLRQMKHDIARLLTVLHEPR